jgi:hypothetical protein
VSGPVPRRSRRAAAAALAALLAVGVAACEGDGTADDSPGVPDPVPGEPGDPAGDLPADTGEGDL